MNIRVSAPTAIAATLFVMVIAFFPVQVPAEPAPATVEIKIDNFSFVPQTVTVPAGTQIVWTNADDIPHTVVSDGKATFKSRVLDTDEKFTFTFTKAGTYSYFCSLHPHMTAKVVVQ